MKKSAFLFLTIFLGTFCRAGGTLSAWTKVDSLPATRHAQIGFACRNVRTGDTVEHYFSQRTYTPASVTKVVSTATALERLGADFRFRTWIEYSGFIDENGTLHGTLFVRGEGDPSLGSAEFPDSVLFLPKWKNAVAKAGIRRVDGDIVGEMGCFDSEVVSPLWLREDLGTYYGAGIFPLSCYDNSAYVTIGVRGGVPSVTRVTPRASGLDSVAFSGVSVSAATRKNDITLGGEPFSGERYFKGALVPSIEKMTFRCDIPNPPMMLLNLFRKELEQSGINVSGNCRLAQTFGGENRRTIHVHHSPTLVELVRATNVFSNNNYAEHIFKRLSAKTGAAASFEGSAELLLDFWRMQGIDTSAAFEYDGSGLTPKNAFSPDFIVEILSFMQTKSANAEAYFNSLPVAGEEGTVCSFLKKFPQHPAFRVKSGSFRNVQCYAGYFTKNGEKYAFCIMVNNFSGARAKIRQFIEEILMETYLKA